LDFVAVFADFRSLLGRAAQDEWRLPSPADAAPETGLNPRAVRRAEASSHDEGESLVGREIMVDQLGVGKVTDFHDFAEFNLREKHLHAWSSPHTVRSSRVSPRFPRAFPRFFRDILGVFW